LTEQNNNPGSPATSNVRFSAMPQVFPDRSVTFSLKAPDAKDVRVAGGDGLGHGPFPMKRGDDGVWTVTIQLAVPGFHYYWFVLDGVSVNDPGSQTYFGYGKETSGIEIPEPGADYFAIQDVPHRGAIAGAEASPASALVLIQLTRWVRLRLRAAMWRQWKTPRRRRAALLKLGVRPRLASNTAGRHSAPGIWPEPKPSRWGFPMLTSNRLDFRH
jgi:hypothetical protein